MITLEKLAGYNNEDVLIDKVAEAMDFMAENGLDPIGGLTALMNVDAEGNVADEKVASELNKLAEEQIDALSQVAEYLAGEDPSEIAKVALEINDEAYVLDKVAEAADYLAANGIDPEDALIIASSVDANGYFTDEKVASEVAEAGYTDYDFDKIAEAIEYLSDNDIGLDEAYTAVALLKEAAPSEAEVQGADRALRAMGTAIKRRIKGAWSSYKAALMGKGRDKIEKRLETAKHNYNELANKKFDDSIAKNPKIMQKLKENRGKQLAKAKSSIKAHEKLLSRNRMAQAKAIGGTAIVGGGAGYYGYKKLKNS